MPDKLSAKKGKSIYASNIAGHKVDNMWVKVTRRYILCPYNTDALQMYETDERESPQEA